MGMTVVYEIIAGQKVNTPVSKRRQMHREGLLLLVRIHAPRYLQTRIRGKMECKHVSATGGCVRHTRKAKTETASRSLPARK